MAYKDYGTRMNYERCPECGEKVEPDRVAAPSIYRCDDCEVKWLEMLGV